MRVKLRQILVAMQAIDVLVQKEPPKSPESAKASYRIGKLWRKLHSEHQAFLVAKTGAMKRHGTPVEGKADEVHFTPEAKIACQAELDTLLNEDVELEGVLPVPWAHLEQLALAPSILIDLEPFIEAPKEE